jgi:hypothetical protein
LKIEPELRAGAEPVTKAQRRVGGHAALTIDDRDDPVHRHVDLADSSADEIPNSLSSSARCSPG